MENIKKLGNFVVPMLLVIAGVVVGIRTNKWLDERKAKKAPAVAKV